MRAARRWSVDGERGQRSGGQCTDLVEDAQLVPHAPVLGQSIGFPSVEGMLGTAYGRPEAGTPRWSVRCSPYPVAPYGEPPAAAARRMAVGAHGRKGPGVVNGEVEQLHEERFAW